MVVILFNRSCSVTSILNDTSISTLNISLLCLAFLSKFFIGERLCSYRVSIRYIYIYIYIYSSLCSIWIHVVYVHILNFFNIEIGEIILFINFVIYSDVSFYCILWRVMELNSGMNIYFLEGSCVGNKWCINIMSVCSARFIDLSQGISYHWLFGQWLCVHDLSRIFSLITTICLSFLLGTWVQVRLRKG